MFVRCTLFVCVRLDDDDDDRLASPSLWKYSERKRMDARLEADMLNAVDARHWKSKKAIVASEAICEHSALERLADPKTFTGQYKVKGSVRAEGGAGRPR